MRKFGFIFFAQLLMCMIAGRLSAQEYDKSGFCPITEGMTLEYVNYDAEGNRTGSYVLHVSSVSGTLANGEVTFDQYFYDGDGSQVFGESLPMVVSTGGPEGTVSRMNDAGRLLKVQDVMSKGDASSVPAGISVGSVLKDGDITVKVGKITAHIITRDRKVEKQGTVTVPAGTFECWFVSEEQLTKALMTKVEKVETWYAPGIGCIKQAVYDRKGRLDHTQELVSLKFD